MFSLLLITYYLLFLFLSIKDLKWAVYLIVFTLPTYLIRFQLGPLPMTLLEGEILILFLVWLIKSLSHKNAHLPLSDNGRQVKALKQDLKNKNLLLLYCFIVLLLLTATISMFISPNLRAAAGIWKAYFVEPILFFIIFISVIKKQNLKIIFKVLSFQVLVLSFFAIYQKLTGAFIPREFWANQATRRVTSVFPYPNALALYLAPLSVLFLGILVEKFKIYDLRFKNFIENWKLFASDRSVPGGEIKNLLATGYWLPATGYWLLVTGLALLAVYFTKSKGALLAILAGIIFYAIFYKGYRKIFTGILLIIFISLFLYFFVFNNNIIDALKGSFTVESGDSISTRLEMWQETWQMLKTRPILGAGLAGYQRAVALFHQKDYIEIYLYPHNFILNFWSEIGLLGLLAFILIIIWFYKSGFFCHPELVSESYEISRQACSGRSRKGRNGIGVILMAAMTALLVHGFVDVPYFKNDLSVLFWILVGMLVVVINNQQLTANKNQDIVNC